MSKNPSAMNTTYIYSSLTKESNYSEILNKNNKCLFSWWCHDNNALWGRCFPSSSFTRLLFLLGWLKLNDDDEHELFFWYG